MDNKKIIVILLLITVVLSIGSLLINLDLNIKELPAMNTGETNNGNVQLIVEKNPETFGEVPK